MAIRSEYIKNLMDSTKSLDNQYEEAIKESMKSILGDSAKKEIRQLLKESDDEDEFDEEDVVDTDADTVSKEGEEKESGDEDTEVWDDLEKCKSADGEYDCTGMDNSKLLQVLKSMGPDDEVRVVSNGDGTATVEVDGELVDGEQEFVIDLDDLDCGDFSDDDDDTEEGEVDLIMDDDVDDELDIDVEVEDDDDDEELEECGLNEGNTGYTDDYQKKTAMTTPGNHEPGSRTTRRDKFDDALPQGTEKRWANRGDNSPYSKSVNEGEEGGEEVKGGGPVAPNQEDFLESTLYEVELDETEGARPNWNSTRKTLAKDNEGDKQFPRSGSKNGKRAKGTGYSVYSDGVTESKAFKQKMNALYKENKQMKAIIPELQKRVEESIVINASMGYIVKLLNENTTTIDEKREISKRFGQVTSLNECKKLYETISNELNSLGKGHNLGYKINGQLAEGKQAGLVETTMYKSDAVNETLAFMKRLNAIP